MSCTHWRYAGETVHPSVQTNSELEVLSDQN